MTERPDIATAWGRAEAAGLLFAVDPTGLGGVVASARPGPVLDRWIEGLRASLSGMPWRKLPQGIDDTRLLGGLDLTATLATGTPVAERGVLAETDGGVLQIAHAELLDAAMVARLSGVIDQGRVEAQRDGLSISDRARFGFIAVSGATHEDEQVAEALADRAAFRIDLNGMSMREAVPHAQSEAAIQEARARLAQVTADDAAIVALNEAALAFGILSLRAPLLALKAARAAAALRGSLVVEAADLELAAVLVLAPRATRLPEEAPQEAEPPPPQEEPEQPSAPEPENDEKRELSEQELAELMVTAALASLPKDLLRTLAGKSQPKRVQNSGKSGGEVRSLTRGRQAGTRRRRARTERLAVVETLRAAAPWQAIRRRDWAGNSERPKRPVEIRGDDVRSFRFVDHMETSTIFVVDASGSSALHRLNEAKGAVELLLSDCYVRRDQVGLIAFRGRTADVLLEPTRSLARAKRCLSALPGGGGTPIALAIDAALGLAVSARKKGRTPTLVFLTDGRANVDRRGAGGREAAERDALDAARRLSLQGFTTLLIDTSPKLQPQAVALAEALRASYVPLPRAKAQTVSDVVRAKLAS